MSFLAILVAMVSATQANLLDNGSFEEGLKGWHASTDEVRIHLMMLIGRSYLPEGKWTRAVENLKAARKEAAKHGDFEAVGSILNYIGDAYVYSGDRESARKAFTESLGICRENGVKGSTLARNISDLAQLETDNGRYEAALSGWEEAVSIYRTLSESREHAFALLNAE